MADRKHYEKSRDCFQLALDVCDSEIYGDDENPEKVALLRNLGAVLNALGRFKEAAEKSELAADIYGMFY